MEFVVSLPRNSDVARHEAVHEVPRTSDRRAVAVGRSSRYLVSGVFTPETPQ